jgi:BMFP domain-containing protein YqiC
LTRLRTRWDDPASRELAREVRGMAWDFETEPEFQMQLDWMDRFVRDEVEPLDLVLRDPYDVQDRQMLVLTRPLEVGSR